MKEIKKMEEIMKEIIKENRKSLINKKNLGLDKTNKLLYNYNCENKKDKENNKGLDKVKKTIYNSGCKEYKIVIVILLKIIV